jgi:tight adherence protein C
MIEYIIPFLLFIATLAAILGLAWYIAHEREVRALTKKIENKVDTPQLAGGVTLVEKAREVILGMTSKLGGLVKPTREEDISHLKQKFFQAGFSDRSGKGKMLFFGAKVLFAAGLPLCFLALKITLLDTMLPLNAMLLFVVIAVIGFYLPDLWLSIKIATRKQMILLGFPDALDLMVICAEAGMGIEAAIARVGEETSLTNPPLSEELRFFMLETRAGKSRRDALQALAMRTGLEDIESFSTLLIQTDKFGTSIARALRVQAESMRVKRSQRVEELAAKLPVKLLFPTILFIFPSLFLVLAGPAMIMAYRMWTK